MKMLRVRFLLNLAIVFFLLASVRAFAFDDWLPITPEDMKLTSAQANGASAVILYHEHTSNDNTHSSSVYFRLKVLTEKGKSYADVEIPHFGPFDVIGEVKARTVAPDGTVTPFSGQVYDREVVKGQGIRIRAKTFTLSDVQVGSIIEWRYKEYWDDEHVHEARWILQEPLLQKRAHFSYIPYTGSAGISTEHGIAEGLFSVSIGLPDKANITREINDKRDLELTDIPAYEAEEYSPPANAMKMRVLFYYGSSSMRKLEDYWKEEGKYWTKSVEKFIGHSEAVARAAHEAVLAGDTPAQQAAKVYALVQKLQNRSYARDLSSAEMKKNNLKSNTSAELVLEQGGGARSDLARLFVAMLRALNMQAFVVRVSPRDEIFFDAKIPDHNQLSEEVAVVNMGDGKDTFFDPGTPGCPFGLLDWPRTGVAGQRQTANGVEFTKTPEPRYSQALTQRVARLTLDENGALKGKIVVAWNGQEALQRRIQGMGTDAAGRNKELEEDLKLALPAEAIVHLIAGKGWDVSEGPVSGTFSVELPGFATVTGKRMLLRTALYGIQKGRAFVHDDRKTPVYFSYPYRVIDDVEITLPAGIQADSVPQIKPITIDFAAYRQEVKLSGETLSVHRDFAIGGIAFPLSLYRELKTFFSAAQSGDEEQAVFKTAAN